MRKVCSSFEIGHGPVGEAGEAPARTHLASHYGRELALGLGALRVHLPARRPRRGDAGRDDDKPRLQLWMQSSA